MVAIVKISIITVTLNRRAQLENCLASVRSQTYGTVEHIIIDGGSTDGTQEFISKKLNRNTVFLSEPDSGIYEGLNKGLRLATGNIVGVLHSDDVFHDKYVLSDVANWFSQNTNYDVFCGDALYVNNQTEQKIKRIYSSKRFKPWMLNWGFMPAHTATFFAKHVYENLGGYKDNFSSAGDFEIFVRFFKTNKFKLMIFERPIVYMSMGGKSGGGIKSWWKTTSEILVALKINKSYSNLFMIILRLPVKLLNQIFCKPSYASIRNNLSENKIWLKHPRK